MRRSLGQRFSECDLEVLRPCQGLLKTDTIFRIMLRYPVSSALSFTQEWTVDFPRNHVACDNVIVLLAN